VPLRPALAPIAGVGEPTRAPLGLGAAPLGNLFSPVSDEDAAAAVDAAWECGIRSFDTAPLYGYGDSERRLGAALAGRPRDEYVVSTKVGRLIRDGAPASPEQLQEGGEHFYKVAGGRNPVFDFSYDGVMRSVEESLERLGLDRVDLLHVHDPDDHYREAAAGAYLALDRLRSQQVVRAIGVGMNQSEMLARFAEVADFDYFLVAGRYTLLDQSAEQLLFPVCAERGTGVVAAGVFNSGILADPRPGATYDYVPAPPEVLDRARRLAEVCGDHGVPLAAAAMQFPARHEVVSSVLVGARTAAEVRLNAELYELSVPPALWAELEELGLVRPLAVEEVVR
jgi:D-threo-aldose 1-dehydrogenase